jgi:hypothetical protein
MGVTICPEHGRRGISSVCPHIAQRVEQKENVTGAVLNVNISGTDEQWPHYFCLERVKGIDLPATQEILPENVFDDFQEAFDSSVPVCGECFRNYYSEANVE